VDRPGIARATGAARRAAHVPDRGRGAVSVTPFPPTAA
jgi:hypothetical protein